MTSFASPTITVPLVFESGVLNVRDDIIVESPFYSRTHPMLTHPDGEETNIPNRWCELIDDRGTVSLSCGKKWMLCLQDFISHTVETHSTGDVW